MSSWRPDGLGVVRRVVDNDEAVGAVGVHRGYVGRAVGECDGVRDARPFQRQPRSFDDANAQERGRGYGGGAGPL